MDFPRAVVKSPDDLAPVVDAEGAAKNSQKRVCAGSSDAAMRAGARSARLIFYSWRN